MTFMKFITTSVLLALIVCVSASNALAGGALVLYFDASQGANAADGESAEDNGGAGGSGQGGTSGGAPTNSGQADDSSPMIGGAGQPGSALPESRTAGDVQSGILDDGSSGLEDEIASSLSVPGIVDELSLTENTAPMTLSTTTDFTSEPDAANIGELKFDPFPTSLPSVALAPAFETPNPALVTVGPSPSGPTVEIIPFGSLGPVAGPTLITIPPAVTSSTPEPTSVMVWMLGAASFVGVRRRQRTSA